MSSLRWTDAMSVGVPALDADHRMLVRIINLLAASREGAPPQAAIAEVLATLKLYGRFHFRREERVMEAIRFPGAAFHRAEHQGFARYIEELRSRAGDRRDPTLARDLFDYLTGWLRHHILIQDMAYKPYVTDRERAEETARDAAPSLPQLPELAAEA